MPITEFTVGASRTINLGNFESLRIEASVRWTIDGDINADITLQKDAAQVELRELLAQTYRNMSQKRNEKLEVDARK